MYAIVYYEFASEGVIIIKWGLVPFIYRLVAERYRAKVFLTLKNVTVLQIE